MPVADVDEASVPYFSLIVVNGDSLNGSAPASTVDAPTPRTPSVEPARELLVVGLGPGPDDWLTPEARPRSPRSTTSSATARTSPACRSARAAAARIGQHRRGRPRPVALDLALRGERVAVVSGGDAGVFGMAAAVFEAAEDERFADVPIRVVPGVSAVQAVAARAGAPIGADFAVLSLSDRLKPWAVIETRLRAIAEADLVLAIYNPASRSRPDQIAMARKVLLEHRAPTPSSSSAATSAAPRSR